MPRFHDLTGIKFGRLTAIRRLPLPSPRTTSLYKWLCLCDCGNEVEVYHTNLTSIHSTSCGCYKKETAGTQRVSHHMAGTRIHHIWCSMRRRCDDPNGTRKTSYYGKGITYCDKWRTFEGFYEDMSEGYADNLSIDRIDNDKGYNKDNCRWATTFEQSNNCSTNHIIEVDGVKDTIANTCRRYNAPYNMVRDRILNGWEVNDAVKLPKGFKRNTV